MSYVPQLTGRDDVDLAVGVSSSIDRNDGDDMPFVCIEDKLDGSDTGIRLYGRDQVDAFVAALNKARDAAWPPIPR